MERTIRYQHVVCIGCELRCRLTAARYLDTALLAGVELGTLDSNVIQYGTIRPAIDPDTSSCQIVECAVLYP